jgi:hypothetical protein
VADAEVIAARLAAQGLREPITGGAAAVVRRLLAVQAQDLRAARLAIRARSAGLTAADVDRALTVDRSLVVSWLNRGTLHLVAAEDHGWLRALTTASWRRASEQRLRQEGVDAAAARRGIEVILDALRRDGPQTRAALRARLDDAGVRTAGQALVHLLGAATIEAGIVRGPVIDGEQAFVDAVSWLGPRPVLERPEALELLGRRYLAGHGPAAAGDLARWARLGLGDARRALSGQRPLATGGAAMPAPRLLGGFDPILHGWASRVELVGQHPGVVTSNGIFRPTLLVEGRIVGVWALPAGVPTLHLLEPITATTRAAVEREAAAVLGFLDLPPRGLVLT